jgi:hypothetical protein
MSHIQCNHTSHITIAFLRCIFKKKLYLEKLNNLTKSQITFITRQKIYSHDNFSSLSTPYHEKPTQ